jgi:16S rRNA (cytidine1402-2'-O)-methyltransferase
VTAAGEGTIAAPLAGGTLYLVATPIGNLEDLTRRAARVLTQADIIACEDTRHTRPLLAHIGARARLVSLHEHNERARIPQMLELLRAGKAVALVSDAGTPVISDPGSALVAAAAREGFRVEVVPGPSAVTAAVALADFPAGRFAFVGFLPRQAGERRRLLEALAALPLALVVFEAPHRIRRTLEDLTALVGARRVVLARELTKVHEEVLRGTPEEVLARLHDRPRGEITLVVEGAPERARVAGTQGAGREPPERFLERLLTQGLSRRDAARAAAVAYGMPARQAYRLSTRGD